MNPFENIPYQGFCWVIGTTSFRTAKLNLKIEQQLLMLDQLYQTQFFLGNKWVWDSNLQSEYYDLMKNEGFIVGSAKRRDKDAREKTSGLVDIGLLTKDRRITQAGQALLNLAKVAEDKEENLFKVGADNPFRIEADSYIYFRQLLKTHINVDGKLVRPYIILAKLLAELKYLSFDEFKYLLPLCSSPKSTQNIIDKIKSFRQIGNTPINDVIYDTLMLLESYRSAQDLFLSQPIVNQDLITTVGMNRKSRSYDAPYYSLYISIYDFFVLNKGSVIELFDAIATAKLTNKIKAAWREMIFNKTTRQEVKRRTKLGSAFEIINKNSEFATLSSNDAEKEFRKIFFKYMHVNKAKATLEDYFDLNRRYFSITDTVVFSDNTVAFDLVPKHFFNLVIDQLYPSAYLISDKIEYNVSLPEIHSSLIFDSVRVYELINIELGVDITHIDQTVDIISKERLQRFNTLIDKNFSKEILFELLSCFETRDDERIEQLVTKEANTPTIFEFILGIIWYEISDRQGNILDFMNLSLDANLLPKTHAGGGEADIVYKYEETEHYPKHSLLIEATLSDSTGQRRMELEPVSRHLGNYLLKYGSDTHYCVFIAPFVHINVLADFRSRKNSQYYSSKGDSMINGMKIIPIQTSSMKHILETGKNYNMLYRLFDEQHKSDTAPKQWGEEMMQRLSEPL